MPTTDAFLVESRHDPPHHAVVHGVHYGTHDATASLAVSEPGGGGFPPPFTLSPGTGC